MLRCYFIFYVFVETADFGSAGGLGCWLVVGIIQARADKPGVF